jgi:hypothetical protein
MPTLRDQLSDLARHFATDVLEAIRGASLDELLAESSGAPRRGPGRPRVSTKVAPTAPRASAPPRKANGGRLARRSPAEVEKVLAKVVGAVKTSKKGLRAEEIKKKLGLQSKELPRVLKLGLSTKKLASKGHKRATTYFAA